MSYIMNYANASLLGEEHKSEYELVEDHGVRVFVDPLSIFYIAGTVMDFEVTELRSEFVFNNPQATGECGCGESFNVD